MEKRQKRLWLKTVEKWTENHTYKQTNKQTNKKPHSFLHFKYVPGELVFVDSWKIFLRGEKKKKEKISRLINIPIYDYFLLLK